MGNIVYINKNIASRKAGSEVLNFYGSLSLQIQEFLRSSIDHVWSSGNYFLIREHSEIERYVDGIVGDLKIQEERLLSHLESQVRSYAEQLCQSPDIDLVLDANIVIAGDAANNMTEQFCNYLVEQNRDSLLVIDRQAVMDQAEQEINFLFNNEMSVFAGMGLVFKYKDT
jgi:hypothetical protein